MDPRPTSPSRMAIYSFTAQWFLVPQGTGIIAVILHQLDYQFDGLHIISYIFWLLTIVLLVGMLVIYLARCTLYPRRVLHHIKHDLSESACLASICITYTSIIQMMVLALVQGGWGKGWGMAGHVMWWTNVALAIAAVVVLPFINIRLYPVGVPHLSPASQLPMIAALTVAAGGGTICQGAEISPQLQIPVIIVSYLFVGLGLPLAFALDVLFWARLLDRSLPDRQHTFQDMILCGPWGQGSFCLQVLGSVVLDGSFAAYDRGKFITAEAAGPVGYASIFAGLLAWGMGTFWWLFAILSITHGTADRGRVRGIPYGLAAWSIVFPWGVYTNAALELGKLLDSVAFRVWSTALAITLVMTWLWNMSMTVRGVMNGSLLGLDRGWKRRAYM
ncbi:putative malic acid transport protein [Coniochaeta ligniaria NRRL 30616]|uniref:Sulfite efflux pump SSU1 n=1 Tax=Coniochaeta ligniaria NRRL 30616 TaxID=1408157 RepID=A0A1J7JJN0_9PEZI|nr:putative malic acid transport protein [Coniochaeta ligniaria NRRL 30616]